MNMEMKHAAEAVLDLLYPRRCPVCDGILPRGLLLCPECERKLPYVPTRRCAKCGKPVEEHEEFCDDCRKTVHDFDEGIGIFMYDETMRRTMAAFKFKGRQEYGKALGTLTYLASRDKLERWKPDVIVPIPLHRGRLRKRGFNQAEEIASEISVRSGIPLETGAVMRSSSTLAMKGLGAAERQENLEKAFAAGPHPVSGGRILLVDDIYTTGSTMDAASRVLREEGASFISFLAVCIGKGFMVEY